METIPTYIRTLQY